LDPRAEGEVLGVPVWGGDELLPGLAGRGVTRFALGLGSAGDNAPRRELYGRALAAGLAAAAVRHPSAVASPRASLGPGVQLMPAAVVVAGAELGENVLVNTGAVVEHGSRVGAHAHLATGCRLGGGVSVGEAAFIGAGAVVRQGIAVGAGALVAAGAVVVEDVPQAGRVAGNPARAWRSAGGDGKKP
jgi:UDP-perosamine 4-acetyltransferase